MQHFSHCVVCFSQHLDDIIMKGVFYIWLLVSIGSSLFIREPLPLRYLFDQGLSILITEIQVNCLSLQAFFTW